MKKRPKPLAERATAWVNALPYRHRTYWDEDASPFYIKAWLAGYRAGRRDAKRKGAKR